MKTQIRFLKVAEVVTLVVTCFCVQSVYAQSTGNTNPDQKMADFRTWDRLDSGAISPESVRGANSPAIQEKARSVAEQRARSESERKMADFRTWDRLDSGAISPESVRGANSPAIREKARSVSEERSRMTVVAGAFGSSENRQIAGAMIMSRSERMLYLDYDRIRLPVTALWDGNARVTVDYVTSRGSDPRYEVTIRTRGGRSLERKIIDFANEYGPRAVVRAGLWAVPGGAYVQAGITGAMYLMKPSPLKNGEGEFVSWDIRAASGTRTRVWLIHESN